MSVEPAVEEASKEPGPDLECGGTEEVIRFGPGSSRLSKRDQERLSAVAESLRKDDQQIARVEGFADPTGDPEANQALSEKRAQAVERYLNREGIDAQRVLTFGRGEVTNQPVAPDPERRVVTVQSCTHAVARVEPEASPPTAPPAPVVEETPPPVPVTTPEEVAPAATPTQAPMPSETAAAAGVSRRASEGSMRARSVIGVGLTAGGGVVGFNDKQSRTLADTGGSWEVRLTLGTRLPLALDAAYVGSAQTLNAPGLSSNAYVLGNGAEGDVRLQWPNGMVRPFVFGGVGWTHYTVERSSVAATGIRASDNVATVPLGLGLVVGPANGVMFEVRLTERLAFDDDLFRGTAASNASLDSWNATARLGVEF